MFDLRQEHERNRDSYANLGGNEIEFQTQTRAQDDDYIAYSPPFWSRNVNIQHENSALLLQNRHYVCPSPTSRLQAIVNARRQLMEMVQNMPESSYELSLKDIVDVQQSLQEVQDNEELDNTSLNFGTKTNVIKMKQKTKKKKYYKRPSQISRSESMDSGVFLIKMFVPGFLGLKKKSTVGINSRVCRTMSSDGSEKPVGGKEWWKIWYPVRILSKSVSSSSSNSSSTSSRQCDSNFRTDCWFSHNKCISTRRQRGCLF